MSPSYGHYVAPHFMSMLPAVTVIGLFRITESSYSIYQWENNHHLLSIKKNNHSINIKTQECQKSHEERVDAGKVQRIGKNLRRECVWGKVPAFYLFLLWHVKHQDTAAR